MTTIPTTSDVDDATTETPGPGTGLSAVVLGGGLLACELVLAVLRSADVEIVEAPTPERRTVAVLVDPLPRHWEATKALDVPVVVVSLESLPSHEVVAAVVNGADAVLHGDTDSGELVRALHTVAAGGTYLPPAQIRAVADALRSLAVPTESTPRLTGREVDILCSIDRGESIKQTALVLGISRKTVENLQTRLFRKLGVRNRAQAIARVHALGLLGDTAAPEQDAGPDLALAATL